MNTKRNCQSCDNYKDGYCSELDMEPCYPENGCDYHRLKEPKTDEWEERLHRALFTREEWEKVLKAMDEIYNAEREARKKAYIRKKALEDRNIEFIMPKETMHVDPIPNESIHTIDFTHGYDYCKNAMKKEIHKLFEETMNGTAGEFIRGWNLALEKVLEVMEIEPQESEDKE